MSESLATTIAAYAVVLAAWTAIRAATGRGIAGALPGALVVIELGALGQAGAAAVGLAAGHDVEEQGVLIAYLAASVAIVPLAWGPASSDDTPWGGATLALGLVALAVVSVRAITLWQG